ncbi:MAG: RNA methyltransferase [Muribaculaceae bacterium]|nr:RNA methyltransferase [Muribaculaceae bacterium]
MEPSSQITNAIIDTVASLDTRKGRRKSGLFKAEGTKCVFDTIDHFRLQALYATREWIDAHSDMQRVAVCAGRGQLSRMSAMVTAPEVIAVYHIPPERPLPSPAGRLMLALDTIQDPGNLGTIIRVADWFGVTDILCSHETASCYSPKVIQATMGSISRVALHYCDLPSTIAKLRENGLKYVYGTFLDGENISEATIHPEGLIVTGNEGNGISEGVERTVTHRLLIPSWPVGRPTGESLNAAIATAITLAKFRGI